jgi:two-component system sensor histidine kinase BaeS
MLERLRSPWRHWGATARDWIKAFRLWQERALLPVRAMIRPRSLARQLAFFAVAIAVCAILATTLVAALAVSNSFSSYLQTELKQSAQVEAARLGAFIVRDRGDLHDAIADDLLEKAFHDPASGSNGQIWVVDQQGNVLFPTPGNTVWASSDPNIVIPALRNAVATGTAMQGALNDPEQVSWLHLSARGYAVAPIIVSTAQGNLIIGAVAISSEVSVGGGPAFIHSVDRAILLSGLVIALIVGIIGALLAQRVTQPISRLTRAAAKMAGGDLSARARINAGAVPAEIGQLAATFNTMAANLQRDVNELRRQEQMQRDLVANVAHELATPLTAISGYSEALIEGDVFDPQEKAEFTRVINRESVRLGKMVDQLRHLARLESGAEKMDLHPIELAPLVDDTLAVLQGESEARYVALHNAIAPDLVPVLADADRLTQVVLNLTDNALRHTPAGGSVTLTAQAEGDHVWVTVADTGPGIAPEDLPHVFERFYRADKSRNRASGGTGLGLAIVKGIVEAHGGYVRAANGPDGGARMAFSLRVAPVAARTPTHAGAATSAGD